MKPGGAGTREVNNQIFIFARPQVGPIQGFVTSLSVCMLLFVKVSRFKELRLSKVSNDYSVSLGLTRVSLGSTRAIG